MNSNAKRKIELTLLMVCTIFLTVSVIHLLTAKKQAVHANTAVDPFPGLRSPSGHVPPLDESKHIVYLTFDDGPSANTERLLEILRERGAKATFFVTAQEFELDYITGMYMRIADEGHVIGLHSYTHKFNQIYSSPYSFLKDVDALRELLEQSCGYKPSIFRFPGGSTTQNASKYTIEGIIEEMESRGYTWYDWDISTRDDTTSLRRPQDIADTIIKGVLENDKATIVLCHDSSTPKTTPEGVAIAIDELMKQGYEFHALPSY